MAHSLGHTYGPQLGPYLCGAVTAVQFGACVAILPQQSSLQGMLAFADEGDDSRLLEVQKSPVVDFPAQAQVFLQRRVGHSEKFAAADGTSPLQPQGNG